MSQSNSSIDTLEEVETRMSMYCVMEWRLPRIRWDSIRSATVLVSFMVVWNPVIEAGNVESEFPAQHPNSGIETLTQQ
jgi:hypothetical protein